MLQPACAMGLSKKMMHVVDKYAKVNKRLDFLETFFNTLAMHSNLSVWNPTAMETIDCCRTPPWNCDDFDSNHHKWFHPIKDIRRFIGECYLLEKNWLNLRNLSLAS